MDASATAANVDKDISYAIFIYPFLFDPATYKDRCEKADEITVTCNEKEVKLWDAECFRGEDFISHIHIMFKDSYPTAKFWTLNNDNELAKGLHIKDKQYYLVLEDGRRIPFRFIASDQKGHLAPIRLELFSTGVGFLAICVRAESEKLEPWFDLLHYFRDFRRKDVVIVAEDEEAIADSARKGKGKGHDDQGGLESKQTDRKDCLVEMIYMLLESLSLVHDKEGFGQKIHPKGEFKRKDFRAQNLEKGVWWDEVFIPGKMIPYSCLYIDGAGKDEIPKIRYRLRKFLHSRQEISLPADPEEQGAATSIEYAKNQWFIFSMEGQCFVAFDAEQDSFFRERLPEEIAVQYYTQFLLVIHQRFALISLSMKVAQRWLLEDFAERIRIFDNIRESLLSFLSRGFFSQVSQRDHHHRYYSKLQEIMLVNELLEEVSGEVREMHEILQSAKEKREENKRRIVEIGIALFALLIGLPSVAFGYLEASGYANRSAANLAVLYTALASITLSVLVLMAMAFYRMIELKKVRARKNAYFIKMGSLTKKHAK